MQENWSQILKTVSQKQISTAECLIQIMKVPIEFSAKRNFQRPVSELGNYTTMPRKDSITTPVSSYSSFAKTPFKADIVNTQLAKNKSPQAVKSFYDVRHSGIGHSAMLSNLKSQLTSIKQEVSRLAVNSNSNEPLEFKAKHKHDRSNNPRPIPPENRDCSFNLQNKPQFVQQMPDNEQNTKRDLDRLRTQYAQKEVELEEQMRKIARLEAQLKQQKKSKDDLQSETEVIRNTCRQFKDQAEKLRQELRMASEKESMMFYDKRELIDRLNSRKEYSREQFNRKIEEITQATEKQKNKLLHQLNNQSEVHKKSITEIEKNYRQLEKQFRIVNSRLVSVETDKKSTQQSNAEMIRRKQKQIGLLKQQIGILQQLTSTRAAEQNCLLLQKQAVEKMCSQKDQQNRRLNKEMTDLRERLQCQRAFSTSLSDKICTKDQIIQNMQIDIEGYHRQLRQSREEQANIRNLSTKEVDELKSNIQRSESQRSKLQGDLRICHTELQALRNSERLAWQQYKVLQFELDKAKMKQMQANQRNRMYKIKQSSQVEYIRQLQTKIQNLKLATSELQQLKINKLMLQSQLQKIRNGLDIAQSRNIQNLNLKQTLEISLRNAQQNISSLHSQLQRAKQLERLLVEENSNVKKRQIAAQQELRLTSLELNQLRLLNKDSESAYDSIMNQNRFLRGELEIIEQQCKQLQNEINRSMANSNNMSDLLNQSNAKIKVLTEQISELKAKVQNLQAQNQSLKNKVKQLEASLVQAKKAKQLDPKGKEQHGSIIQRSHRDQISHKDSVIRQLKITIGRLQHNLHISEQNSRRLRRTEQVLCETNDMVARLRLRQLQSRLQEQQESELI